MESGAYGMRIADPLATLFRLRDPLMLSKRAIAPRRLLHGTDAHHGASPSVWRRQNG